MSNNYSGGSYQQYGGNPYGSAEAGEAGYGQQNPYGGGYGASNPYGGTNDQPLAPPPLQHGDSTYSQPSEYSQPSHQVTNQSGAYAPPQSQTKPLSKDDFLERVGGTKTRINHLAGTIQRIGTIHQQLLGSTDQRASDELNKIVADIQVRNTQIKDEIKFLERDASREPNNRFKTAQVDTLKTSFREQLNQFQQEESSYRQRYRDAIKRQYRIVNPEATDSQAEEAAAADWGNEGVFQQALLENRSGQASNVLGAVRARHRDIQLIEKTISELALLFEQLNEQVVYQEHQVTQAEMQTEVVKDDTEQANVQLDKGIESARRARRLKWYTLLVVVIIICILALALGIYFGTKDK